MDYIRVKAGTYRNQPVVDEVFPLIKHYHVGAKGGFVTVNGSHKFGVGKEKIRISVRKLADYTSSSVEEYTAQGAIALNDADQVLQEQLSSESDDEVMARIADRFDILREMTEAARSGSIRAMIVTGPPGCGKSWGVENVLEKASLFDVTATRPARYEIVKGAATPIGLYQTLYKHSESDHVLVLDDADQVFYDSVSLNLLKSALDSGRRRKICWLAESRVLKAEGIPSTFEFKGSIIFITNLKFDNVRSKSLKDHLMALESRCHYLDLTLDTTRDKLLRIKQIANAGDLFNDYGFTQAQEDEIINFLFANHHSLREVSLRSALKIADLYKSFPKKWEAMARTTVMKTLA